MVLCTGTRPFCAVRHASNAVTAAKSSFAISVVPKTEDEKQTLRNSFAGKKVSQMSPAEREVFDEDFQYGFGNPPIENRGTSKAKLPKILPTSTLKVLQRMGLAQKK